MLKKHRNGPLWYAWVYALTADEERDVVQAPVDAVITASAASEMGSRRPGVSVQYKVRKR